MSESQREKKDAGENLKLLGWLDTHRPTIVRRRPDEVASYAESELGFRVTENNIKNLYDHLGIRKPWKMPMIDAAAMVKNALGKFKASMGLPV